MRPEGSDSDGDEFAPDEVRQLCWSFMDKYSTCLKELEQALDSKKKRRIADCIIELYWCDRDVKAFHSGELLLQLQSYLRWQDIAVERERIEEKLPCLPLRLNATLQSSDTVVITCTNLAGSEVAELTMDAQKERLLDVRRNIRESVPLPKSAPKHASWKLISPLGKVLDKSKDDLPVGEALGLLTYAPSLL